ncbi:hypothetical protein IT413_02470 [Candidatus Peregrinibacteria bacterium]|nr:hypothetical protein [Candidatus Peregrinibacteria bacterium]
MGDKKKTNNPAETPNEKQNPEVKKDGQGAPESLPPTLTNIKKEEKETKESTAEKASRLKRELLEKEITVEDSETIGYIQSINANKESKEQAPAYQRLELVMYTLIAKILDAGKSANELADFDSIKKITFVEKLNAAEKAALTKLQEIAGKTTSPLYRELKVYWSRFVSKATAIYEKSASTRDVLLGNKEDSKPESKIDWVVKQAKKHPFITAALMAGAAYGAYKIFFSGSKKSDEQGEEGGEDKQGFFESMLSKVGLNSTKKKLIAAAIGTLVLGGIIGHEKIGEVISKLTNISKKHIDGFIALIKQGKYKEAMAFLFGFGDIKETVEKDLAWLDEKIHFSEAKESFKKFCQDKGIQVPEGVTNFVKDLHLGEIAKELGISQGDEKSWLDYVGTGGGALLIYKFMGKKGLAINAGLYMFIVSQGKDSFGGKILHELAGVLDTVKNKLIEGVKNIPGADLIVEDAMEGYQIQNGVDDILTWMKEHPLESMAAMNGLWLGRHLLFKALKKLLKSGIKFASYVAQNPGKAAAITAVLGALYFSRKELIRDAVNAAYDNPNSPEAKEMLNSLYGLASVDPEKPTTLTEKAAPSYLKAIMDDPLNALKESANIIRYKNGEFSIGFDSLGKTAFLLVKGTNIPVVLGKLTWESFKLMGSGFSPDTDGNILTPMVFGGTMMYIFGSASWEGFKSYKAIYESAGSAGGGIWRIMKSLVPGSKEWRFVMKSAAIGPFTPILRKWDSIRLMGLNKQLEEIIELSKDAKNLDKVRKMSNDLMSQPYFSDFNAIRKDLVGTNFSYRTAERLDDINRRLKDIETSCVSGKLDDVQKHASDAKKSLDEVRKGTAGVLERFKKIAAGDLKGAQNGIEAAADLNRAAKEAEQGVKEAKALNVLNIKQGPLFRNKDGSFKATAELEKDAERIAKEVAALDPSDVNRIAKEKELMALEVYLGKRKLSAVKVNASEIGKLEGAEKANRIHTLAQEMEATEKGLQAKFNAEVEAIVKEAKAKNIALDSEEVMGKLEKLDKEITIPHAQAKQKNLQELLKAYEELPSHLKTPTLNAQLRHTIEGVDGTLMTRVVKGVKGRCKMMALMAVGVFALDQYMHRNDAERDLYKIMTDLGPELGQLVLDVAPVTGTFSNYYSAISGKEIITKRDVSGTWDRVSNALWGTVGLVGDAVTVIEAVPSGGTSVWGNMRLRLLKIAASEGKMANSAKKLIKYLPKLEKIAERMGGMTKMIDKIHDFLKDDRILKNMKRFEKAGLVVGTAMVVGGLTYNLRYAFVDKDTEIKIPPELIQTSKIPVPDKTPMEITSLEYVSPEKG